MRSMNSEIIINNFQMVRYNLKIIFGNKFIYFLVSALALSLFIVGVNLFSGDAVGEGGVYSTLLLVGALLLFYPVAYGIQSEKDGRTLEVIFGIPDYRYRVWLMRLIMIYAITIVLLFAIGWLLKYVFVSYSILGMIVQVMVPLLFLGLFTFFLSTVLRSGNATAAVVIILGVFLLILGDEIGKSYWNIFFNPYNNPSDVSTVVWQALTTKNRIFLMSGSVVFLLGGLMNLQKRERLLG